MIAQVCVSLTESQGGLYRYVCDFQASSNATTISLVPFGHHPAQAVPLHVSRAALFPCMPRMPRIDELALAKAVGDAQHIVCHSLYRGHVASLSKICHDRGTTFSVVTHGMLDPYTLSRHSTAKRAWLMLGGRHALESADHIIFSTHEEMRKAMAVIPGARPCVVRPGVASPRSPSESERRQARAAIGVTPDERLLVWLGRLDPMKRILETIQAFGDARCRRTRLAIAGYPSAITAARISRAIPTHVESRTCYLGPVDAAQRGVLFSAADGFVSFSHRENFGYAFAEALAAGLPCLVSPGHDLLQEIKGLPVGWIGGETTRHMTGLFRAFDDADTSLLTSIGRMNAEWAATHLSVTSFRNAIAHLLPASPYRPAQ